MTDTQAPPLLLLTADQFKRIAGYAPAKLRNEYLPILNSAFQTYRINTPLRMAAFLAQFIHETGSLCYETELADGDAYDHRADLGNTLPEAIAIAKKHGTTPGPWFKGEGGFQYTGYSNFLRVSKELGIDCVNDPKLLAEPQNAVVSSCLFWNDHNLSVYADVCRFDEITRRINGGYNGKPERDALYKLARHVLNCS